MVGLVGLALAFTTHCPGSRHRQEQAQRRNAPPQAPAPRPPEDTRPPPSPPAQEPKPPAPTNPEAKSAASLRRDSAVDYETNSAAVGFQQGESCKLSASLTNLLEGPADMASNDHMSDSPPLLRPASLNSVDGWQVFSSRGGGSDGSPASTVARSRRSQLRAEGRGSSQSSRNSSRSSQLARRQRSRQSSPPRRSDIDFLRRGNLPDNPEQLRRLVDEEIERIRVRHQQEDARLSQQSRNGNRDNEQWENICF